MSLVQNIGALVSRVFDVRKREVLPVIAAFFWFFMLFACYNILRPIRDAVGSSLGQKELSQIFVWVLIVMLVAVPSYSQVVNWVRRTALIQIVFHFLAANILLFATWNYLVNEVTNERGERILAADIEIDEQPANQDLSNTEVDDPAIAPAERNGIPSEERSQKKNKKMDKWFGRVFFVWTSVFILFAGSVIWSFLADVFSNEQGKRLFGPIASGATLGSIAGAQLAGLAPLTGLTGLLVVAVCLLEVGVLFATWLARLTKSWTQNEKIQPLRKGGFIQGLNEIRTSPYLMLICCYLALLSVCGTALYMQLSAAVGLEFSDKTDQIAFYAKLNLIVQIGTLIVQTMLVSRLMKFAGLSVTLCLMPIVYFCCYISLGFWSGVIVLGAIDVVARITAYGATVPAREVLFTVVSKDAKYKSKNFMDTVVIRGADAATSSVVAHIPDPFRGFTNWYFLPIAMLLGIVGWTLGSRQKKKVLLTNQTISATA
jgi:AAA family ATP:ADP antiporter